MATRRLMVIGGGIAGLAGARAALRTAEERGEALEVTVLEASDRLGGKVLTEHPSGPGAGGGAMEMGPDGFLVAKPEAERLARELGLGDDLVATGPEAGRAYLYLRGKLRPLPRGLVLGIPTGAGPLFGAVRSGIVPPLAALRAGLEPFVPGEPSRDRPVAEVARRRLGRRVAERLVSPLVEGVFGAPAGEVSFEAALPQFAGSRSLVLTQLKRPAGSGPAFRTLRHGLSSLIDALRDDVVRGGGTIETSHPASPTEVADAVADGAVVIATPAPDAATLLRSAVPEAAAALSGIRFRGSAMAWVRFRRETIGVPLDGSGYLAAPEERRTVAACSWVGAKWPHLAGDDMGVRAIVTAPEHLALGDEALVQAVVEDLRETMATAGGPAKVRLHRWDRALPIYAPGHRQRVEAIEAALPANVAVAGASYRGFGLSDCIRTGEAGGRRMAEHLLGRPATPPAG